MTNTVNFLIDHLDPLGQGVSRRIDLNNKSTITFVPKTLPGEQGTARMVKSVKGVEFAELAALSTASPQRITPDCEHYERCSGCDYLHVSYVDEIAFKKTSLQFLLRAFSLDENTIEIIAAPQRFGYRNRVQLHYRHKYLGLIDANSDQVLEIPQCKLVSPLLKTAMEQLYRDKHWTEQHPGRGHVELYEKGDSVQVEWNGSYASGGFSQINPAMNDRLREWLHSRLENKPFFKIIDLFSGAGNLSELLLERCDNAGHEGMVQRQLIDSSPWPGTEVNEDYLQLDLYDDEALNRFQRRAKLKQADLLLLDPPRKGFPALAAWVAHLKPSTIAYVSCNPATLARDVQALLPQSKKPKYSIARVLLLDMFPGTRHFETVLILQAR